MTPNDEDLDTDRSVLIDLADAIDPLHVRSMTHTLARILVEQALVEHGIKPANDNESSG